MTQDSFMSHIQISNQSFELKDDFYTLKQRFYFYNVINWFLRSLSIRNKTDMKSTFINTSQNMTCIEQICKKSNFFGAL